MIQGGDLVSANSPLRKSVVHLRVKRSIQDKTLLCSGVLIAQNLVLTAAHCAVDCRQSKDEAVALPLKKASEVSVFFKDLPKGSFGSISDVSEKGIRAKRIFLHSGFRFNQTCGGFSKDWDDMNDLAVIQLERPADPARFTPIPFATEEEEQDAFQRNSRVLVAGFGRHVFGSQEYGRMNSSWGRLDQGAFHSGRFGLRFQFRQADSGDSGSPAFIGDDENGYRLVGILSYMDREFTEAPTIFMRLRERMEFLESVFAEIERDRLVIARSSAKKEK
jgi:secreted trypsin-like serine protease